MGDIDPYHFPASLIAQADELAGYRALGEPFGEWGRVQASICLARLPLEAPVEPAKRDASCAELLSAALEFVDAVPAEQRRPSHSLDRAYVAAALARVQELSA
jgi:hypothetical protein